MPPKKSHIKYTVITVLLNYEQNTVKIRFLRQFKLYEISVPNSREIACKI